MTGQTSKLSAFLAELKRRRVFRVAIVYAGVAFIISEIVANTFEPLGIPDGFDTAVIVLLILGFPIAVGLAWAFDITEKGIVRTKGKAQAPATSRRPILTNWTLGIVAALAIIVAVWALLREPSPGSATISRIAVLPLYNIGGDPKEEYFVEGMHEAITSNLSRLAALTVISRTSTMRYKDTDKLMLEIARELNADALVEGSAQRIGDQVLITAQLIDGRTDEHLWNNDYEGDLTDILLLQKTVARAIAEEIGLTLTPEEEANLASAPQVNPEAFDYYLRGNAIMQRSTLYLGRGSMQSSLDAIEMHTIAVELDPTFTEAYAALAISNAQRYNTRFDHTPERLAMAKSALDKAMALAPDHPAVHSANGYYYYWCLRDYESALEHFNLVFQMQPNDGVTFFNIGYVRAALGMWEAAAANFRKAAELDPRHNMSSSYAFTAYRYLRNWVEAERFADRLIFMNPEGLIGYYAKVNLYLYSNGDIEKARGVIQEGVEELGTSAMLNRIVWTEIYARDYQKALAAMSLRGDTWFNEKSSVYSYMGQQEQAAAYYDSIRVREEWLLENNPDDSMAHGRLGGAYAVLGRTEEAIREGNLAVETQPLWGDGFAGPGRVYLAQIYNLLGEQDAAIDQLELLLSIPSPLSVGMLEIDPQWDPLREHPRFKALVEKYGEG